jgi:hypothetical protein
VSLFKNAPGNDRERYDYNGAATALSEAEWVKLAARRTGAWVVVIDEHVVYEGRWMLALGNFLINTHAGTHVRMVSHTDFVQQRLVAALLES